MEGVKFTYQGVDDVLRHQNTIPDTLIINLTYYPIQQNLSFLDDVN